MCWIKGSPFFVVFFSFSACFSFLSTCYVLAIFSKSRFVAIGILVLFLSLVDPQISSFLCYRNQGLVFSCNVWKSKMFSFRYFFGSAISSFQEDKILWEEGAASNEVTFSRYENKPNE